MKKKTAAGLLAAALSFSMTLSAFAQSAFYREPASKKGLLVNTEAMLSDTAELQTKQAIVNVPMSFVLNGSTFAAVDHFITGLSDKGITVTVILLNDRQSVRPELIYGDQGAACNYFMLNVFTDEGRQAVSEVVGKLAAAWQNKVSNWVIGNEIQDQTWNYIGPMDADTYCRRYAEVFRTCYDIIRSQNSLAEVYIPFDYGWMNEMNGSTKYNGRTCLDKLSAIFKEGGDIDWGVAWHAYPDPLTSPVFWDDGGYAPNSENAYIVNLNNLNVLTDYMQRAEMLGPDGKVRNIILSEQGFSSLNNGASDENLQAAAFAYGYFLAEQNPYIKGFYLNRQTDAKTEVNAGRAFGLWNTDMNAAENEAASTKKYIWQVFRDIDGADNGYIKELVKNTVGVDIP
ncbi:MAG: DUF5722 domain-containing protein [Eubacteriales bacterium]|nr:DUF5722 domain-containing protein [Eubacteriales bacterium]